MKYLILITSVLFSNITWANSSSVEGLDLSSFNLKKHGTSRACEDVDGHEYRGGTTLTFVNDGKTYTVYCDNRGFHTYTWEVKSVTQSLYSNQTWEDGLGCRDAYGRIHEEGRSFSDTAGRYLCKEKNGLHYLVVE